MKNMKNFSSLYSWNLTYSHTSMSLKADFQLRKSASTPLKWCPEIGAGRGEQWGGHCSGGCWAAASLMWSITGARDGEGARGKAGAREERRAAVGSAQAAPMPTISFEDVHLREVECAAGQWARGKGRRWRARRSAGEWNAIVNPANWIKARGWVALAQGRGAGGRVDRWLEKKQNCKNRKLKNFLFLWFCAFSDSFVYLVFVIFSQRSKYSNGSEQVSVATSIKTSEGGNLKLMLGAWAQHTFPLQVVFEDWCWREELMTLTHKSYVIAKIMLKLIVLQKFVVVVTLLKCCRYSKWLANS